MFSISIQAGGLSKRMGTNKALILFKGVPLVQRILNTVQHLSNDIFITTNTLMDFPDMGVTLYKDLNPDSGALSGLITALHYAQNDIIVIIACDMPFIVPSLMKAEFEMMISSNADVVIPRTDKGLEPLFAAYRVSTCLPAASKALEKGQRKMISWFDSLKVCEMGEDVIRLYDPDLLSFININTPEDLYQAEFIPDK